MVIGSGLAVENVSMNFDGLAALSDVSFSVSPGEVVGIIGTNGSGKSTLLNCVSGVYTPSQGKIKLDGEAIAAKKPHSITRKGVSRTFQHTEVPPELSVIEVAMLGRHALMRKFGLTAYGLGLPNILGYERVHRQAALESLAQVGVDHLADELISEIPYGLAKRVDLARALAGEPRLLLLDEPAAGLNVSERIRLADSIEQIANQSVTMLLVEHDLNFVSRLCTRVLVFVEGRLLFDGAMDDAFEDEGVTTSFFGGDGRSPHH